MKQTKTQAKSKPSKHISYPMEVAINWANLKGLSILQNETKGLTMLVKFVLPANFQARFGLFRR